MHIVLIKPDGIGDYFLYRNFPPLIKQHFGPDCRLTGILKPHLRGFADVVDDHVWDRILWLEPQRLTRQWVYRKKWQLIAKSLKADLVVYPIISRTSPVDWLVSQIPAQDKIASVNNLKCMSEAHSRETDSFYTRLIPYHQQQPRFEFYSLQDFMAMWLQCEPPANPFWDQSMIPVPSCCRDEDYVMLFPGAGASYREWPAERYGMIARDIVDRYRLDVIVAGSRHDRKAEAIVVNMAARERVHACCGKHDITATAGLVSRARLVIANDSAPMHLAALLKTPLVAISKTRDYGRYHPYPAEYGLSARFVYPPQSDVWPWNNETPEHIRAVHDDSGSYKITDVLLEQVIDAVQQFLSP